MKNFIAKRVGASAVALLFFFVAAMADNWMTPLPDDTPITQLSIPGTHDSATGEGFRGDLGMAYGEAVARTQELTLSAQWDCGIRAFDLRPAVVGEADAPRMQIYHGRMETRLGFSDALQTLCRKLDEAPGEFAIVIIRHESDINTPIQKCWRRLMAQCIAEFDGAGRLVHYVPGLTLGDVRGKILLFSRDDYEGNLIGAYVRSWTHTDSFGQQKKARLVAADGKNERLMVQDFYDCTTPELLRRKLSTLLKMFKKSAKASSGVWVINHASGYTKDASSDGYRDNATQTNNALLAAVTSLNGVSNHKGITMIDYAGVDDTRGYHVSGLALVKAIIAQNRGL